MHSALDAVESRDHLLTIWSSLIRDQGGEISTDHGLRRMWADSDFGFWNTVTPTGAGLTTEELQDQLERARSFMASRSGSGYLWIFEDLLQAQAQRELPTLIAENGLKLAFSGRGMAGEPEVEEPGHPDLEFRRVQTEGDLAVYGEINGLAYGMSAEVGRHALGDSALWRHHAHAYLASRDGKAVACAAVVPGADTLFLALVATHPGEGRRGYGEAVTRKAIHEGVRATGIRRVVLHSTEMGQSIYQRIGLKASTAIHFYQLS